MWWRKKRVQEPPSPDALATAAEGMAKLLDAITSAKIREIEATAQDREREFEQRQKDREAAREARRKAAENARKRRSEYPNGRRPNDCPFCANPFHYPFTIEERDRHLAHSDQLAAGMRNGQS